VVSLTPVELAAIMASLLLEFAPVKLATTESLDADLRPASRRKTVPLRISYIVCQMDY
jgi:hypothetical protein